jgi:hypothetical protein
LRLGLVVVFAAVVIGGLVPHALPTAQERVVTEMVTTVESPLAFPSSCADATCGKGSPAPAAPVPAVALAAALTGLLVIAALRGASLRRPLAGGPLPSGVRHAPYHPPQFS